MGDTFMANCCAQSNGRSFVAHMMCEDGGAQVGGCDGQGCTQVVLGGNAGQHNAFVLGGSGVGGS